MPHAERLGEASEIRIAQIDAKIAAVVATLLDSLDECQAAVIDEYDDDGQFFLNRGGELHAAHQEATVADDGDDGPLRKGDVAPRAAGMP